MRAWWMVLLVVACSKKQEPAVGSASGSAVVVAVASDAAIADAAPAIDASAAVKTGIEVLGFEGLDVDKLMPMQQAWIGWIESHFTKCESDEKVEGVTTTATLTWKADELSFDLPKVPDKLAACIKHNVTTPYLGYDPVPPRSFPRVFAKIEFKVKLKIGPKAPPLPPDTSPVKYVASKIKGARDKKELGTWLDDHVARQLKPCIEDTPIVQDLWKIELEIDAAGQITKVTAPGDANVAACVRKVIADQTAPKASGTSTVELVYAK
ncbi:MAG TPA: hypothetical protein VFQ53_33550 [Kofleriaceae bacterium]|nr:hypothetical protein [Kofleriaceae bacterium]